MTDYLNYGLPATVGLFGHVVWIAWVLKKERTRRPLYTCRVLWLSVSTLLLGTILMIIGMYGWLLLAVSFSATLAITVWFAGIFEFAESELETESAEETQKAHHPVLAPAVHQVGRVGVKCIEVYGKYGRTIVTFGRPSQWLQAWLQKNNSFPAE